MSRKVSIGTQEPAISYARNVGLIEAGVSTNLEVSEPAAEEAEDDQKDGDAEDDHDGEGHGPRATGKNHRIAAFLPRQGGPVPVDSPSHGC